MRVQTHIRPAVVALTGVAVFALGAFAGPTVPAGTASATPVRHAKPSLREEPERANGVRVPHPEGYAELAAAAAFGASRSGIFGGDAVAARLAAFRQAQAIPVSTDPALGRAWKELGPKPFYVNEPDYAGNVGGYGWHEFVTGRVTALAVDPTDRTGSRVWAGFAGGGVWYSADAGTRWVPKGDRLPSLAIGSIAVDPKNPKIVYVGTGEANTAFENFYGTGVYRTRDGGDTWERVPKNIRDASTVSKIAISSAGIFVATNKGLFRSTDGGRSYHDLRLPTNAAGTAPSTRPFGNFVTDVVIHPDKPNQITAAVGWRKGKGTDGKGTRDAEGNGLYRSTDGGVKWNRMNPSGFGAGGRSDDPIGRVALAYAYGPGQDHDVMWAIIQDAGRFRGETFLGIDLPNTNPFNGVYRSGDDGLTWDLKATTESFAAAPGSGLALAAAILYTPGIQSWYNMWVAVDPGNEDTVLVGLEEVYQTAANANGPGLAKWKTIGRYWNACLLLDVAPSCEVAGGPYEGKTVHPDQHAYAFAPTQNGTRLYAGNDGGVYRQDAGADGEYSNTEWASVNETLGAAQPYYAVMSRDGTVYTGLQDNGNVKITPDGKGRMVYGGDGGDVAVHPDNPDISYEEYVYAAISKTRNGGITWESIAPAMTAALFITPFEMDPENPNHLVIVAREIMETAKGVNTRCSVGDLVGVEPFCDWMIAYDLGQIEVSKETTKRNRQSSAVDVRGADVYVGWCGICDIITQSSNIDPSWFNSGIATNVKPGCTPETGKDTCWHLAAAKGLPKRYVGDVAIDPADRNTIYVTLAGYSRKWWRPDPRTPGVGTGNLYVSHDAGQTFRNISFNLPDAPANALVVRGDRVYVATDIGVFTAPKTGGTFARLGTAMPASPVLDLNLNPQGTRLVAATHGRGIWSYDFGSAPARAPTKVLGSKKTRVLPATGVGPMVGLGVALLLAALALAATQRRAR